MIPQAGDAWVNDLRRRADISCVHVILIEKQVDQGREGWMAIGIEVMDRSTGTYRIYEAFMTDDQLDGWYLKPDRHKELVRM